jgi:hypothetical protein
MKIVVFGATGGESALDPRSSGAAGHEVVAVVLVVGLAIVTGCDGLTAPAEGPTCGDAGVCSSQEYCLEDYSNNPPGPAREYFACQPMPDACSTCGCLPCDGTSGDAGFSVICFAP